MSRFVFGALFAGMLSIGWLASSSHAADSDKCTIATKGESEVAKACKAGGIKRAKATMKQMQKVGKEKGMKVECDDCHKDESAGNWTLNKDAEDKFKKLAALQK
jgi:hypothetical protein